MRRNHSKRTGSTQAHTRSGRKERQPYPAPASSEPDGAWIWGTHAVLAALANPQRRIEAVLATENAGRRLPALTLQPTLVTPAELDARLPRGAVHQGIAVKAEPLAEQALEDVIAAGASRLAILDQVSDPHNMGAIFRSAAAFGFTGLILQSRNAPPVTGVVAKSAAGAIETVCEIRVVNIARALEQLGEAGFHTIGLAGEGSRPLEQAVSGARRLALVLGAEGSGLRPGVARACAELAHIPIAAQMESLNVSNAAAIAFYVAARSGAGEAPAR